MESAWRLCRTAIGQDGTVLSAHRTTVDQVRQHRGGPPLRISRAEQPWSSLPGDAMAAWCAVRAGSVYTVSAVSPRAPVVAFMTSSIPLDVGPGGPPVP
jgi:hypothetical protein